VVLALGSELGLPSRVYKVSEKKEAVTTNS
jgi:hypothetical protein